MLGSVALVDAEPGVGQLRWFLLVPEARGTGLGRRMLDEALAYCRTRGLTRVYLLTFAALEPAVRLYSAQVSGWWRRKPASRGAPIAPSCAWNSSCPLREGQLCRDGLGLGLLDVALDLQAALGEVLVALLHQEGIEPAAVLDRLQCMCADAQLEFALQRVADQRHVRKLGRNVRLVLFSA